MPDAARWMAYDYALLRVVPHVHLEAFCTVGVVLHCRQAGFLDLRYRVDADRLHALAPDVDVDLVERYCRAFVRIAHGEPDAGPIALLTPSERFHWLTAPRSAVIQPSPLHTGRTIQPETTLQALCQQYV